MNPLVLKQPVILTFLLNKSTTTYQIYLNSVSHFKGKSRVDKIIVKKQPYQLLNTNREFFPRSDASNFHKLVNESW